MHGGVERRVITQMGMKVRNEHEITSTFHGAKHLLVES